MANHRRWGSRGRRIRQGGVFQLHRPRFRIATRSPARYRADSGPNKGETTHTQDINTAPITECERKQRVYFIKVLARQDIDPG